MDISTSAKEQIATEAAEWFLRFQNADRSAGDYKAFSEWLTRSPVHIEEYLAVSSTWVGLNVPDEGEFSTDALIAGARTPEPANVRRLETHHARDPGLHMSKPRNRDRRLYWAGLAASMVLGCGAWLAYARWYQFPDFKTAVGEQRSVSLSDGSIVILNTNSEVRVRWTAAERRIDLVRGEGRFHVAKNPDRPFLVSTQEATVKAVGTVFNVRDDQSGTQVAVLEGRVKVSALTAAVPVVTLPPTGVRGMESTTAAAAALVSLDLAAGQRAAVTVHGIVPDTGPTVEAVAGWTERRLVFRDQRLADVVAEFNRYRVQPLMVDDTQLADLKISGVFDPSDPESLVTYLKSFETVMVQRPDDGSLRLSRGVTASAVQK